MKFRIIKISVLLIYFFLLRILLYSLNFPSRFLSGALVDPAYFSSTFAGGVVKSPIEFFITAILFLIISVYLFRNVLAYVKDNPGKRSKINIVIILFLSLTFFLSIRAVAATLKSIIFDSTIRYFKEPDLIPDLPSLSMNVNVFIFGLGSVLLLCSFILIIFYFFKSFFHQTEKKIFIILFISLEILGLIFYLVQSQPLITPLLLFLIVGFVFLLSNHFYKKEISLYNYIYAALVASVLVIIMMNHFNLFLERNSLKTVAYEINRPNDNLIRFHIVETLKNTAKDEKFVTSFLKKDTNYDAVAFLIWSNSSLQIESLHSSVSIFNRNKEIIGSFSIGIEKPDITYSDFGDFNKNGFKIFKPENLSKEYEQVFTGIIEVKDRDIIVGYISATIVYDLQLFGNKNFPDFMKSGNSILSPVVDISELKVFEFTDSKVSRVYGDIYPSRDHVEPIWHAEYSQDNDAWVNLTLNEEKYLAYLTKSVVDGKEKVTAILLKEKQLTWNLFNFFKLFVIHSLFILILLLGIFLLKFKKINYTFRGQLLIAFLIISIIPVVVLAIYNREIVKERTRTAVINELNERLKYLENHILEQKEKYPEKRS